MLLIIKMITIKVFGRAVQLASAMNMKFHEVSSSNLPDLQCVSRKEHLDNIFVKYSNLKGFYIVSRELW